jgi:hypothetical protein
MTQFATNQKVTDVNLIMLSSAAVVHFLLVMLFVYYLDYGFTGICVATLLMFIWRMTIALIQIDYW